MVYRRRVGYTPNMFQAVSLWIGAGQAQQFDFDKWKPSTNVPYQRPQSGDPNTLAPSESRAGFKLMFDGKSFTGWHGWKQASVPKGWEVRDGAMWKDPDVFSGDILSNEKYTDFELRFEWKVAPGANSGVFYRVDEAHRSVAASGAEYQILDDEKHADGKNPLTCAASAYAIYARSKAATNPVGQWNHGRIISRSGRIEHWLNGWKVVEYRFGSDDWRQRVGASKFNTVPTYGASPTGSIALQDHGDEVAYRSLRIKRL